MKTEKKATSRTCCGCGGAFEKKTLIRIVRTPEGEVKADFTGKANGRGAYLCRNTQCLQKARKNRRLAGTLKTELPDGLFDELARQIEEYEGKQ